MSSGPLSTAGSSGSDDPAGGAGAPGPPGAPATAVSLSETATRASIFLKLNHADRQPREIAWRQFYEHYAPVISGYAQQRGATRQQADEVVQEVICGFFSVSPRFVYQPSRGRFRAYLKTCAGRALSRIRGALPPAQSAPVEDLDVADERDEHIWEQLWRQQMLRRATDIVRQFYTRKGKLQTFLAFEQNVVRQQPAPQVAAQLGISAASVHVAKSRVTEKIREVMAALREGEG
jgi:RNA polymerase sigma factor (sigma-70 family)